MLFVYHNLYVCTCLEKTSGGNLQSYIRYRGGDESNNRNEINFISIIYLFMKANYRYNNQFVHKHLFQQNMQCIILNTFADFIFSS